MKHLSSSRAFALVATLAIVVVVTIFLVAFATTMRTERSASQNFVYRDQAESMGMGMINRIIAEHASPMGLNNQRVKKFTLNETANSGLPTEETALNYYAATLNPGTGDPIVPLLNPSQRQTLEPIYRMVPENQADFDKNCLVLTSQPAGGGGTEAYNSQYWAYEGLTNLPDAEPGTVPKWVNYFQADDPATPDNDESQYPVAQVAFAVWDESGKFDVNVIGEDKVVNGLAPHNLGVEQALIDSNAPPGGETPLTEFLNGANGTKERSNFGLRTVSAFYSSSTALPKDKGDDLRIFSLQELVERNLINSSKFNLITSGSWDFDVRPEWDGDRAPKSLRGTGSALGSEDFLRSYINNPNLFKLFYGSGKIGPYLVMDTLNNQTLLQRLTSQGTQLRPSLTSSAMNEANWMQVMRLLSVLRRGLPRSSRDAVLTSAGTSADNPFEPNAWFAYDIWGVGENLIQASAVPSDYNLVAFNPDLGNGRAYYDPNVRVGIRISPYIVECTLKVKKSGTNYIMNLYLKLWNPYPYKLLEPDGTEIKYRVGMFTGYSWPSRNYQGLYGMGSGAGDPITRAEGVTAPEPGKFKVIKFTRTISRELIDNNNNGNHLRIRPYIQEIKYCPTTNVGTEPESPYATNLGMPGGFYGGGATSDSAQLIVDLSKVRNKDAMADGEVLWYSFQIDDPRMGSVKRPSTIGYPPATVPESGWPTPTNLKWSWILYPKHALSGSTIYEATNPNVTYTDPDISSNSNAQTFDGVTGYNKNFGSNWPGGTPDFAKMMATFALPGRPFLNIGEIGTVFANRPWVTLNFADVIVPKAMGGSLSANTNMLLRPAAILDYFTTIGTPNSVNFNNPQGDLLRYLVPGPAFNGGNKPSPDGDPGPFVNIDRRTQDKNWLFETVDGNSTLDQTLKGNLRPIRGRINLNTASKEVIKILLKAPYRMPPSLGLKLSSGAFKEFKVIDPGVASSDYLVTIKDDDAENLAKAVTLPITDSRAIRPLRMLSDLSQLYDQNKSGSLMADLYSRYPQSVVTAMIGRLAQFGTVRQQSYTIDMVVRTLNPAASRLGNTVITGEARLQARVYFDTFSRKSFIESVRYR